MLATIKSILLKDSFKQVGAYTITASLCKAISFAALPFFVNTLSEGDIGILNILNNSIVFLTPIISMGVLYSFSIEYFKLPKEKYAAVFSSGLVIPVVLSLFLFPLLYVFRGFFENAFNFPYEFFWLIPLSLFFNFCFEAFIILVRNQNNVKLFTSASILKIFLEISLSVVFIIFVYRNWYSRALGGLLAAGVLAGLFFHHIRKQGFLVRGFDYKIFRHELYFGLSGLLLQTAIFFVGASDKFFVMSYHGKEQAGYYSVAATFATIQYIVCVSLLQYLQPVLFTKFAAGGKWRMLKGLHYKYMGAMLLTVAAVMAFTVFVYYFVLKETYREYLYYFYILAISSFIWTIANLFLQFIVFNKNQRVIFFLSVSAILFSLLVNYVTSVHFSIDWLCAGQVLINLFVLVIILLFNRKLNYFG